MTSVTVFLAVYVLYATNPTARTSLLWTPFNGFYADLAALLVAVKQIMPHKGLHFPGGFKLSVKVGHALCAGGGSGQEAALLSAPNGMLIPHAECGVFSHLSLLSFAHVWLRL